MEFINYQELFDYSQVTDHQVVNLLFVTLLGIFGSFHFLHTAYADKIRTRMIYESFIMVNFVALACIILQPRHIMELGGIMIVNTAPLIAHFITFTKGKVANILFIAMLIIALVILLFNLFIPEITLATWIQSSIS